jgi:hypothetical protein
MPQLGERNSRLSNDANHHGILDPSISQKETYADLARQPRVPHRDAQVATMDHQRLEALSRALGTSVARKRFFALSSAGGVSALAAIWSKDLSTAKRGSRKKRKRRTESKKSTRRRFVRNRVTLLGRGSASPI